MVERSTQKEIVIGKKGEMLKRVGSMARLELEEFMEKKIFLEMHVRVEKEWRNNMSLLLDQGYHFQS